MSQRYRWKYQGRYGTKRLQELFKKQHGEIMDTPNRIVRETKLNQLHREWIGIIKNNQNYIC
ncbi:hypothetical protein [Bacillus toyonensis]|uniref:hypothetical protein n=1 Tax=Bacillus toyonensis TaxID=155322 RepID=UPI0011564882|nr:hypothetical protein [Bacillus toyonensis]